MESLLPVALAKPAAASRARLAASEPSVAIKMWRTGLIPRPLMPQALTQ
jgi:hypothetical protein